MKSIHKIVLTLILAVMPLMALAQLAGPQGGTGVKGFLTGYIPFGGSSYLRLATSTAFFFDTALSKLFVTNYSATNGTTTNSTSTNISASSSFKLGSDLITDLTGSGLSIVGGALTAAGGSGSSNWTYNGSRLSPSTTVGIGVFASSTIGDGTGAGGLTVNGGATTTGNAYFGGNVGIGINSGNYILETNNNPYFNGVGLYTTQKKESANQKETVVTTFQTGHGYTNSGGNGTLSDDTSVYAFGAQSIKMINDAIGSTMIVQKTSISPTIDVSNKIIKITAMVDSTNNISNSYPSRFWLAISSDNFNNYKYCEFAYNIKQLGPGGTWLDLTCSLGDLRRSDTVDLTKINAIRIYSRSTNVTQATWWLNKISLVEVAKKPIISIVFDDGNSTDYTEAMKVMSQYGFPGTSYIIPSGIGTAGYMTLNQLNILKDNQGWQIATHDVTDFTTLTSTQLESRFIYLKNWMIKNGFSAGADDMAYPNGNTNTDVVIPLVKKYFRSARLNGTAGIGFTETSPYGNANALNSYAVRAGDATSTVYAQIDTVVNNGGHLILVFHKLTASPSSPEYSINGFSDIMGYINTYASVGKVKVKTISDAFNNEYQDNFTKIFQLPNGYLGIGTTTPSRLLTVNGDAYMANLTATGSIIASASSTIGGGTNITGLTINGGATTTGKAYFGSTVFTNALTTSAGTPSSICQNSSTKEITVNAALTCTVSARDQKDNIKAFKESALAKVMRLTPSLFVYRDDYDRERLGFIADEVQAVDPLLGDAYKDGEARSIDLPALTALNTKAIQELYAMTGEAKKTAQDNLQNILIGLLALYVIYNEWGKRKH